jgi:hypothetical protein
MISLRFMLLTLSCLGVLGAHAYAQEQEHADAQEQEREAVVGDIVTAITALPNPPLIIERTDAMVGPEGDEPSVSPGTVSPDETGPEGGGAPPPIGPRRRPPPPPPPPPE